MQKDYRENFMKDIKFSQRKKKEKSNYMSVNYKKNLSENEKQKNKKTVFKTYLK